MSEFVADTDDSLGTGVGSPAGDPVKAAGGHDRRIKRLHVIDPPDSLGVTKASDTTQVCYTSSIALGS